MNHLYDYEKNLRRPLNFYRKKPVKSSGVAMRHTRLFFTVLFFALPMAVMPVYAADPLAYNPRTQEIAEINRIKPLQNPRYDRSHPDVYTSPTEVGAFLQETQGNWNR